MSNTDKLLRAFIEAQGYEIKRVRTGDEKCDCYKSNPLSREYLIGCQRCQGTGVSHGMFDYKVTKEDDLDLIKAIGKVVNILYAEFSYIEPDILLAFEKAGWVNDEKIKLL